MIAELLVVIAMTQTASSAQQELVQIERDMVATWQKGDCAAWGAMLSQDWSLIFINGGIIKKNQALEMCRAQAGSIAKYEIDDFSIKEFGDMAVVTGRTVASSSQPTPMIITLRFTDVFVRRAGRWMVVASHATRQGF